MSNHRPRLPSWLRPAGRNRLTNAVAAACWVIAFGIIAFELLRLVGLDVHSTLLIALSTAWPLVVLTGFVVLVGAMALRRPSLAAGAVVCLVILVTAWWPTWHGEIGAGAAGAPRVRVLALNIEYSQPTGAAASRQIRAANPDVVVLSELSSYNQENLNLKQYHYSFQRPRTGAFGQGIWSRWPLTEVSTWSEGGDTMVILTVHSPQGNFRLFQVHTHSPQGPSGRGSWRTQLKRLRAYLATERMPLVAAGDFNASRWDQPFRDLLGGGNGVSDAGAGRGYLATWPSGRKWLPPVLPLDHVLVSRGIGVRGVRVLGPVGSDHRGLLVDLAMPAD